MGDVRVRMGNIFEGAADVTVLPCSAKGTVSSATKQWLSLFGLPLPLDLEWQHRLGDISELIGFPGPKQVTKYVVFAASVLNDFSSAGDIMKIGANLGELTRKNADITLVEAPLLGTGAGGLRNEVACEALYQGFTSSSRHGATLCIFVFDRERNVALCNLLSALDQKGSRDKTQTDSQIELASIATAFRSLRTTSDRQAAGFEFERMLDRLFRWGRLAPREPFRLTGEQIDGSLELDDELYLVEAKWEKGPSNASALYGFQLKIEGKSPFTRGVFICVNGITSDAEMAITRGKRANFFLVDGDDLEAVFEGATGLADLLRAKRRRLAEQGQVHYPAREIVKERSA